MKMTCAALLGAAATAAASLPAQAGDHHRHDDHRHGGVRIGTLACREAGGWGFILGSSHPVHCIFIGNERHGPADRYTGSISKVGVDVGYQASAVIVWAVLARTDHRGHDDLAGHYTGATANASVGVGAGANVLLGSFHETVTLQPVSFSAETGLHVAAGIGELTLEPDHGRD
jgi:hypothetical protein